MIRTPSSFGGEAEGSFAQLIAGVLHSRIARCRGAVRAEIDVDSQAAVPADPEAVGRLVAALIDQAIEGMDGRGDLTITLWHSDGRWELEVADTGPAIERRPRRLPLLAAQLGAQVRWQNCPQGGAAVTLCFDDAVRRRAAA